MALKTYRPTSAGLRHLVIVDRSGLWKGAPAAACWHAGKVSECGGQATSAATGQRGVFIELHETGFDIEPLAPGHKATVHSISAHLLYENKDPWRLTEPGGVLETTGSQYEQLTDSKVRVTGSKWNPKPYTMKLEGASGDLFQTIMIIGITDPNVLAEPQVFHDRMAKVLNDRTLSATDAEEGDFNISLRMYGWNGVNGVPPPEDAPRPREIGVVCVITAKSQELASEIAKACNPYFFHMPIRDGLELPSYGLMCTPADIDRGPVYQFELNHVVRVNDPMELVRMEMVDVAANQENVDA